MQRKGPLPGKIFALCIPERRFAGLFGCMARISCRSQLILDTWRRYVAANWRFSRPRPLRERMKRKSCHGSPPGNASRRNTAMADSPKTHRGDILPLPDVGERIPLAFCHRRAPRGGASRRDLATAAPSRMLLDDILPRRPSAAWACCEIAVVPRSRKTPPEQSVCQFNNARRHVQETMKIFWRLSPRNGTENVLA